MQTFIQDILHTYTYTYIQTVVNNSSLTHKVRCYPTLVTARKECMRTHRSWQLTLGSTCIQSIYIVSFLRQYMSCDWKIVFLIMDRILLCLVADLEDWQIEKNSFISDIKPKVETSRVKYSSVF